MSMPSFCDHPVTTTSCIHTYCATVSILLSMNGNHSSTYDTVDVKKKENIMLHFAICPLCRKESTLTLNKEQEARFASIDPQKTADVKSVLPEITDAQAALLYSGLCEQHYNELRARSVK